MFLLALLVILPCPLAQAADGCPRRFEYSQVVMGVRARIVVYAADEDKARNACACAFQRIADLEDVMSDYRPASELMRVCARAGGEPVKVSGDLLRVLRLSQHLARRSDGAFDVTIGPVVRLWRSARRKGALPGHEELLAARELVGRRKLLVDTRRGTVRLETPGMLLDLGGIAKGYTCDEAQRVLKRHGVVSALVEMGGDIAVSGPPPGKPGWDVEIANAPDPSKRLVTLSNAGISSSGDAEQFVEIGGVRYSHIVDPRTGIGLTDRIAVTVVARDCATSDGLSTAISVLGEERGRALLNTFRGASAFVRRSSDR